MSNTTATLRIRTDEDGFPVVHLIAGSRLLGGGKAKVPLSEMATATLSPMESCILSQLDLLIRQGVIDMLQMDQGVTALHIVTDEPVPETENIRIFKARYPLALEFQSFAD